MAQETLLMTSLGLQVSFFIYTIINYTNQTFIIIGFYFYWRQHGSDATSPMPTAHTFHTTANTSCHSLSTTPIDSGATSPTPTTAAGPPPPIAPSDNKWGLLHHKERVVITGMIVWQITDEYDFFRYVIIFFITLLFTHSYSLPPRACN